MTAFYEWAGGRKVALGLLYAALVTVMAFPLSATFVGYAAALATGLGITSGTVAWEDSHRGTP